jgi:long-chain acyl-CoA synthetase
MSEKKYTLPEKLTEVAKEAFDQIVLQMKQDDGYDTYTYRDLYNNAQSIAKTLVKRGIRKGDRVAIVLENRPEWVFIYFGILFAGAIAVPLDPQSLVDDLKYFFENSASKVIFTSDTFQAKVDTATVSIKTLEYIVVICENSTLPDAKRVLPFKDFLQPIDVPLTHINVIPEDIASILYTSGTTGKPKGVMLTHQNFYSNFEGIDQLGGFNRKHYILSILPLHHAFPFMVTLLFPVFSKGQATYVSHLDSNTLLACMQDVGITVLVGVPELFYVFYQTITARFKNMPFYLRWPCWGIINLFYQCRKLTGVNLNKYLLHKIHKSFGKRLIYFVCGGAKLDKSIEVFLDKIGFTLLQGYGLTETSPIVTLNPIQKPKIGSVGKPIPNVQLKIINTDADDSGEITVKGPNVMKGYYHLEKETHEVLKEGWFYTSDLGYLDKHGYLYLTGRKNDLIVLSNGKNISPEEVEAYYVKSPYIKELCVLSIENNQKLVAVITPDFEFFKKKGELNIDDILKTQLSLLSKTYPPYKCIMGFVVSKESLPRTRLGKLKRYEVKSQYLKLFKKLDVSKTSDIELTDEEMHITSLPVYAVIVDEIKHKKPDLNQVNLNDHLGLDLNFDSLARVELISALANRLSIRIKESAIANVSTVKELVLAVNALLNHRQDHLKTSAAPVDRGASWQEILAQNPESSVIEKIDIKPNWRSRVVNELFFDSLYLLFKLFFRLTIKGVENLPKNEPFILCPNHVTFLDAFFIGAVLPRWLNVSMFFLGERMYFDVPIIRHIIRVGRIIPIDPATHLKDAMQACSYVLKHKRVVCIFPEGRRSIDGSVQPFRKGVGILAQELNVPLVPVYIKGAFDVLPIGKRWPRLHRVSIIVGKPYTAAQLRQKAKGLKVEDDYEAIARGIEQEVENLIVV